MPTYRLPLSAHPQTQVFRRLAHMLRCWCVALVVVALTVAAPAYSQEGPPALIVRLRDMAGAGVPGAAIIITDASGATVLARATSDASGAASFGPLPVADVRILVQGRLADGTPLSQPGLDAQGIAVILGGPPTTLELRSEADGTVLPDPATELTLEPGVDAPLITLDPAHVPSAPPAPVSLAATVAARPTAQATGVSAITSPAALAETEAAPALPVAPVLWPGLLLLSALFVAVIVVLVVQLRWRRS